GGASTVAENICPPVSTHSLEGQSKTGMPDVGCASSAVRKVCPPGSTDKPEERCSENLQEIVTRCQQNQPSNDGKQNLSDSSPSMTQIETELLHTLERQQTSFNLFMNQFLELASLTVLESGPAGEKMNDTGMVFKNLDQHQREVYAILNRLLSVILDLAHEAKGGVDVNQVRKVLIDLMNRYQADFYRTMTGFLRILTDHLSTEQNDQKSKLAQTYLIPIMNTYQRVFQSSIVRMLETISFISQAQNVNTEQVADTESMVKIIMKKCLSMINETVKKVEELVQRFASHYPVSNLTLRFSTKQTEQNM
ncbi:hypothetical protein CRM22_006686, partial [Opisthorchis felineus]